MIIDNEENYLTVVTFIQGREKDPENYLTQSRQYQDRIIVEDLGIKQENVIILDAEDLDIYEKNMETLLMTGMISILSLNQNI